MRARIKVVGLGKRQAGYSEKMKRDYDFLPVSFVFPDDYYQGFRAATANISGSDVDSVGGLVLDKEVEAIFHYGKDFRIIVDALNP